MIKTSHSMSAATHSATPGQRPHAALSPPVVHRPTVILAIRLRALWFIFREALRIYGSLWQAIRALIKLNRNLRKVHGGLPVRKIASVNNRYYFGLMAPGFPSPEFQQYARWELQRLLPGAVQYGMQVVFFGITKKCPLHCEHCYEAENINRKETLTLGDLIAIVHKFQDYGTGQFLLEGGEPMMRYQDILRVLDTAHPGSDFWIISSGFSLTPERAKRLKASGLTGVIISLDHHLPEKHNAFRGHPKAFDWAMNALASAQQAELVTALSLCVTPAYIQAENLDAYLQLARQLGVAFVQILEAQPVGRYAGRPVTLSPEQKQLLAAIYRRYNTGRRFRDFPILFYPAYHQKHFGCYGGGNRFLYIDTDGDLHACPFCRGKVCHALQFPIRDSLQLLRARGCHKFATIPVD